VKNYFLFKHHKAIMGSYPAELSLTAATAKFFEVTAQERRLHMEMKRLLRAHIDKCIEAEQKDALYEVPRALSGSFGEFDVHEMTLWLLKQARAAGFQVQLETPTTIRVSGWYNDNWLEQNCAPPVPGGRSRAATTISMVKKATPPAAVTFSVAGKRAPAKHKLGLEEASAIAQQGTFSKNLRERLERVRRNGK